MRALLLVFSLLIVGCSAAPPPSNPSAPPVSVATPPSGSLTSTQLSAIADDIRELGDNPLGAGAVEGRRTLLAWLTGSPDVSVSICASLMDPFTSVRGDRDRILFFQPIFDLAEQEIRSPSASRQEKTVAAFRESLSTYEALVASGLRRDRDLGDLLQRRDDGRLDAYVATALAGC